MGLKRRVWQAGGEQIVWGCEKNYTAIDEDMIKAPAAAKGVGTLRRLSCGHTDKWDGICLTAAGQKLLWRSGTIEPDKIKRKPEAAPILTTASLINPSG